MSKQNLQNYHVEQEVQYGKFISLVMNHFFIFFHQKCETMAFLFVN